MEKEKKDKEITIPSTREDFYKLAESGDPSEPIILLAENLFRYVIPRLQALDKGTFALVAKLLQDESWREDIKKEIEKIEKSE